MYKIFIVHSVLPLIITISAIILTKGAELQWTFVEVIKT